MESEERVRLKEPELKQAIGTENRAMQVEIEKRVKLRDIQSKYVSGSRDFAPCIVHVMPLKVFRGMIRYWSVLVGHASKIQEH